MSGAAAEVRTSIAPIAFVAVMLGFGVECAASPTLEKALSLSTKYPLVVRRTTVLEQLVFTHGLLRRLRGCTIGVEIRTAAPGRRGGAQIGEGLRSVAVESHDDGPSRSGPRVQDGRVQRRIESVECELYGSTRPRGSRCDYTSLGSVATTRWT